MSQWEFQSPTEIKAAGKVQRCDGKELQASVTIEASFLMPIIIFAIIAVMQMSLHLYTLVKVQSENAWKDQKTVNNVIYHINEETGEINYANRIGRSLFDSFGDKVMSREDKTRVMSVVLDTSAQIKGLDLILLKLEEVINKFYKR